MQNWNDIAVKLNVMNNVAKVFKELMVPGRTRRWARDYAKSMGKEPQWKYRLVKVGGKPMYALDQEWLARDLAKKTMEKATEYAKQASQL